MSRAHVPSEFEAPVAFYFGVIDILQRWTWSKVLERSAKRFLKCLDGDGLSAMAPLEYKARFNRRGIDLVGRGSGTASSLTAGGPDDGASQSDDYVAVTVQRGASGNVAVGCINEVGMLSV